MCVGVGVNVRKHVLVAVTGNVCEQVGVAIVSRSLASIIRSATYELPPKARELRLAVNECLPDD